MKPSEIFEGEDSSLKKAFENTKTMRERFDEFSNREVVGSTKLKDFKYLYPDLLDFIEQELKKEREEIVEMIELNKKNNPLGERAVIRDESLDEIINTIKNRT